MSYIRITFLVLFLGLAATSAYTEDERATCASLIKSNESIAVALINFLGKWESCKTIQNESDSHNAKQILVANWKNLSLTVKLTPPNSEIHGAIYIVETTPPSPLNEIWLEDIKENFLTYFDMQWDDDLFLGPSAEYYLSKHPGDNGQMWIERDDNNAIKWLRFSYVM